MKSSIKSSCIIGSLALVGVSSAYAERMTNEEIATMLQNPLTSGQRKWGGA